MTFGLSFLFGIYSAISLVLVIAAIVFLSGEENWGFKDAALVLLTCIFWPVLIILVAKKQL